MQLPDGRWHWEPPCVRPLCQVCESDADLYKYDLGDDFLFFCSEACAEQYAKDNDLYVNHRGRRLYARPYNGAAYGFSPYDLMDFECRSCFEQGGAGGYPDPEDYDCCDDAEDYGEEM